MVGSKEELPLPNLNDLPDLRFLSELAWPATILLAWFVGEMAYRWLHLPRISAYALIGFALAPTQAGLLPDTQTGSVPLLANMAFALILFECGYRINLRWLRHNPWMAVTSLSEAALTFGAIYGLCMLARQPQFDALMLAALAMASSPATMLRVIHEQHASGQVTERVLHLAAMNCVLAVFVFKVFVGLWVFQTSGSVLNAVYSSLVILLASAAIGWLAGLLLPAMLRVAGRSVPDSTLAFAVGIVCVVALSHSLKLSPVLAALTFGMTARHSRVYPRTSERGFGMLGELLSVLLFAFVASTIEWRQAVAGIGLGLAIVVVRQLAKTLGIGLLAHFSGITWRKGALVGLASMPLSAFVILMLEQTRHMGLDLFDRLTPLAAAALTIEILGPVCVQSALRWARETPQAQEES